MQTVKLPIFDENGKQLKKSLVIGVELLQSIARDSGAFEDHVYVDDPEEIKEDEWRTLTGIPTTSFEINQDGVIRYKRTSSIIKPRFDPDYLEWKVFLRINGQDYWVHGPRMARLMWKEKK